MRAMFGKSLEAVGLMVVGSALLIGFNTRDATMELKLLGAGMVLFFLGHSLLGKAES